MILVHGRMLLTSDVVGVVLTHASHTESSRSAPA